ncbi:hypothetical protein ANAEL_00185 [Anaerolineales bacterium]|nr:hypothetical protein ANAEL_00185 [Anaerolineales bacterium]
MNQIHTPWIEIIPPRDRIDLAGPGFSDYQWQALFACQIGVPKHNDWVNLRWGFNAAALFDEAMKRQDLFLTSRHGINNELRIENPNRQTLTFRYIHLPSEDLLLTMLGKVYARSKENAEKSALAYYCELKAAFPYDYALSAADSRDEFCRLSGWELLAQDEDRLNIAQIRRCETPIQLNQKSPFLQGFWHSNAHAHEQIWRLMAALPGPVLMNTLLRSTVIYDNELQFLTKNATEIADLQFPSLNPKALKTYKEWSENFANRRQDPWQKFFYLQIHLVSTREIDENIIRNVGACLTMNSSGQSLPGYQVKFPVPEERREWGTRIRNLDIVFSGSYLPAPRLSEVADMDEVLSAIRIPYSPPGDGFLDANFSSIKVE